MQEEFRTLFEKYPRLIPEGTVFFCNPGWLNILDRYFAEVDEVLPADKQFNIRQIKEKLGGLRLYCEPVSKEPILMKLGGTTKSAAGIRFGFVPVKPDALQVQLTMAKMRAEGRSVTTCEQCGEPGVLRKERGYLFNLFTACDEHARAGIIVENAGTTWNALGKYWKFDSEIDDLVDIERPED